MLTNSLLLKTPLWPPHTLRLHFLNHIVTAHLHAFTHAIPSTWNAPFASSSLGELLLILQYPSQVPAPLGSLSSHFRLKCVLHVCARSGLHCLINCLRNQAAGSCLVHCWVCSRCSINMFEGMTEDGGTHFGDQLAGGREGLSPTSSSSVAPEETPFICLMFK